MRNIMDAPDGVGGTNKSLFGMYGGIALLFFLWAMARPAGILSTVEVGATYSANDFDIHYLVSYWCFSLACGGFILTALRYSVWGHPGSKGVNSEA